MILSAFGIINSTFYNIKILLYSNMINNIDILKS